MASPSTDRRFGLTGGTAFKVPVACATTANITLSGEQSIDGVTTASSRVLVKNQTTASANGIYNSDTGSWTRAADFDGTYDAVQGTLVYINGGSVNAGQVYQLSTATPVIGTSSLAFSLLSSSPSLANIAASSGASLVGYVESGSGAIARTVQAALRDTVNALSFCTGDGATLDQTGLQNFFTACAGKYGFMPPGTYLHNALLYVPSNALIFAYGATIKAKAGTSKAIGGVYITDATFVVGVSSVNIKGLTYDGNISNRSTGVAGGAGIYISASHHIALQDVASNNCPVDGIQIAGDTGWAGGVSSDITFINVKADGNVRTGLQYGGVDGFRDFAGTYTGTTGSGTGAGVDGEPNSATSYNRNCKHYGLTCSNNAGNGLNLQNIGATCDYTVYGLTANSNGGYGYLVSSSVGAGSRVYDVSGTGNTSGLAAPSSYAMDAGVGANSILQSIGLYVSATTTDTSGGSYIDVSGVSQSITPKYANSKLVISASIDYTVTDNAGGLPEANFVITDSGNSTVGSQWAEKLNAAVAIGVNPCTLRGRTLNMVEVVNPSSGVSVTYKLRFQLAVGDTASASQIYFRIDEVCLG